MGTFGFNFLSNTVLPSRHYSVLPDTIRHYPTLFDTSSTLFETISTLFDLVSEFWAFFLHLLLTRVEIVSDSVR